VRYKIPVGSLSYGSSRLYKVLAYKSQVIKELDLEFSHYHYMESYLEFNNSTQDY